MKINRFLFYLLCSFGWSILTTQAQVPQPTVISSLPYEINAQGNYVLGGNLTFQPNGQTQAAITVNVGYVTIDFNGFYIIKPLTGDTSFSFGISAFDKANITVKNGTIIGFYQGIRFDGTNNNLNNTVEGMSFNFEQQVGILLINARNNLIRDCLITNAGVNMQGNPVTGEGGIGIWIRTNPASGNSVINNRVTTSFQVGILTRGGVFFGGTYLEANVVSNCPLGFDLAQDDKYRNNTTITCQTPFVANGATDLGGNN